MILLNCRFLFLLVIFTAFAVQANAQQTIFNVPSSDILDNGKVYFELDATFKTNNDEAVPGAEFVADSGAFSDD